jgi:hypothetical protein
MLTRVLVLVLQQLVVPENGSMTAFTPSPSCSFLTTLTPQSQRKVLRGGTKVIVRDRVRCPCLSAQNVIDHSGNTYFPSSNDIPYEYPASASVLNNSLPTQDPDSDYIYYDKLSCLSQGLDFSYSDNRALSVPTIPPPIVHSGVVLPDELPRPPAVPDIPQAATPPQTTAPQILSPSLPNGTAGGTAAGTANGTSGSLTSLTAEQPNGPHRNTRQRVPSKYEQALNDVGSSNARICTGAGVTGGKEMMDLTSRLQSARPSTPTHKLSSEFSNFTGQSMDSLVAEGLKSMQTWWGKASIRSISEADYIALGNIVGTVIIHNCWQPEGAF